MQILIATFLMAFPSYTEAHPSTNAGVDVTTSEYYSVEAEEECIEPVQLEYIVEETISYDTSEIATEDVYIEEADESNNLYFEEMADEVYDTEEEAFTPSSVDSGMYLGSFQATSYAVGDGMTPNTYTRNGTDVSHTIYSPEGYRIVAVDTNVIPLNTILRVHVPGWEPFDAIAADTGSAIVGNIIDILVASPSEAAVFGRQSGVEVYILN